jgi:hypothetical protein
VSGDELDDAIDAAVREILGVEQPAGLRHRVLRRLQEPAPRRLVTMPRLAVAGTLAVAIVAGAVATRDRTVAPLPVVPVSAPVQHAASVPLIQPAGAEPRSVGGDPRRFRSGPTVGRHRLERTVSATSIEEDGRVVAIPPLEPLDPIEPAAFCAADLRLTEIAITPLRVEPMRLDLLSSTPRAAASRY